MIRNTALVVAIAAATLSMPAHAQFGKLKDLAGGATGTSSSSASSAPSPPAAAVASRASNVCITGGLKGSTQVRRSAVMWAPQPRASPRSRARLRM